MKNTIKLVPIFLLLIFLVACGMPGATETPTEAPTVEPTEVKRDGAEVVADCANAVTAFFETDALHIKEHYEVAIGETLMIVQENQGWYRGEEWYKEVFQNNIDLTCYAVIDGIGYIKRQNEEGWVDADSNLENLQTILDYEWDYTQEQLDFWKTENGEIAVSFVTPVPAEVQNDEGTLMNRETFIFDLQWNLLRMEIVADHLTGVGETKAVMTFRTVQEFQDTAESEIVSVLEGIRGEIQK